MTCLVRITSFAKICHKIEYSLGNAHILTREILAKVRHSQYQGQTENVRQIFATNATKSLKTKKKVSVIFVRTRAFHLNVCHRCNYVELLFMRAINVVHLTTSRHTLSKSVLVQRKNQTENAI